ncbi:PREDICTED: high affinity immunoglobulin alpha and immunoglobulin mu Fc receptor isoform X2 [Chinchilla lanigera]|uniref:high affinity immunoglobulin alpha and immunoglobulin mu Fc receptor isoform X2 n=1 Tax=Chinchilla lanigera TaxID=34839 RepID=UPI000698F0BE|nr:PREDICTED: high affinity immunoglobulin alpha and immunoglobulin mu Fc receptor isoform X2 [Chinchilla lanigera]
MSPKGSYFWTEVDGEAPQQPPKYKVSNRWAEWRMPFLLLLLVLCLLQAVKALKGPRLVSGELGGAVTIQCHYAPLSVNRHQRKYWCRVGPPMWTCHTIVSTNRYIRLGYHGRVALTDFPQSSLFVVRLSQLSMDDEGNYRCGIGDSNNMLFFSMNLTVSAGEFLTESSGIASPAAKRWPSGATQTPEGQRTKWDKVAPTRETRKTTASAKRRQTPVTVRAVALATDSGAEGSVKATVPIPQSPGSKLNGVSTTAEDACGWGTGSLVTKVTRVREGRKEMTTTEANKPGEQTERTETAVDAARKTTGTIWPSAQAREALPEATMVSKQPALGSTEGATPAAGPRTLNTTHRETASVEGSPEGDLRSAAGGQGPQATPSQGPVAGPQRPSGKGSSRKSASPEVESGSRILTPVSTLLAPFLLVALVLLQRRIRRKRSSQEAERTPRVTLIQMTRFLGLTLQSDQLPHMEREILQGNPPPPLPPQAGLTVLERDPGP